jgi:hypothetical protein
MMRRNESPLQAQLMVVELILQPLMLLPLILILRKAKIIDWSEMVKPNHSPLPAEFQVALLSRKWLSAIFIEWPQPQQMQLMKLRKQMI